MRQEFTHLTANHRAIDAGILPRRDCVHVTVPCGSRVKHTGMDEIIMNHLCRIELLGHLNVSLGDQIVARFRTQKTGRLLSYLAFSLKRTHPREELIELLWPETDLEAGRTSLRTALASLRRQLEPPGTPENSVLIADRANIRLNSAVVETDTALFETLLAEAERSREPEEKRHKLTQAIQLYRGPLLPGFYEDWVLRERDRLAQSYVGALQQLALLLEQIGDVPQAILMAQRAVAADPLLEEAHQHLIRLYAESGQSKSALQQYDTLKRLLHTEMGELPSPELRALAEQISQGAYRGKAVLSARSAALPPTSLETQERPILGRPSIDPPQETGFAAQPRLPMNLTPFFGREEDLRQLEEVLLSGEYRLVTLTGAGGSGKTRLTLEIARRLWGSLGQRVYFASLADVTDPRLIAEKILGAMGLTYPAEIDPLLQVERALAGAPSLLILDNFEQLEDGSDFVLGLLQQVPSLICLVTSRHRLGVGGEREFPLATLPVPAATGTPEELAKCASVRLLVDRAQAAKPDFQITRENTATIAAICERLEGIPLAIELAAAWAGMLTPAQILARLEHRFELLTSRRKDIPSRHRTLHTAIEWSYRLLTPELQRFLAQLSVFRGGWTLEAAESVCEEPLALLYLQQLRERSLILTEEQHSGMHFRILETIREYAETLVPEEQREGLMARHLRFFLALAEEANPQLHGPEQKSWMEKIEQAHPNIREALRRSHQTPSYFVEGLRLASHLHFFWFVRGYLAEGYRWITDLLDRVQTAEFLKQGMEPAEYDRLCTDALIGAGELAYAQGDFLASQSLTQQCLEIWQRRNFRNGIAYCLCYLGLVKEALGEITQAEPFFQQSLTRWRELQDKGGSAHSLKCLAINSLLRGDTLSAQTLLEEGLALYREIGNRRGTAMVLHSLGNVAMAEEKDTQAQEIYLESLAISRELGDRQGMSHTLYDLGEIARRRGDTQAACALWRECAALEQALGLRESKALQALDRLAPCHSRSAE